MTVKHFEELEIWKSSRELVKNIYGLTSSSPLKNDFGLRDQIQRAAVSIMNNIAEGFERNNNKEFIRFLLYSKGSTGEIQSLLYVCLDLGYISQESFNETKTRTEALGKQNGGFIKYLKNNLTNKFETR